MKLSDVVLAALEDVDWDKEFESVLEMLFVGFALKEKIIKAEVPVPEHLRPRLDSSLSNLKRKFEDGGAVRGFFLKDPHGPVEAARAWLAERRRELAQLLPETGGGAIGGNVDDVPQGDEDKAVGAAPPVVPSVDDVPHVAGDKAVDEDEDGVDEAEELSTLSAWLRGKDEDKFDQLRQRLIKHPVQSYSALREDYRAGKLKPRPYVVEGLFRLGELTMVAADGGVGKSWFGLQAAYCISTGKRFLGRRTRTMRSLYFDCEMGKADEFLRLAAIAHKLGDDSQQFPVHTRDATPILDFTNEEYLEYLLLRDCKKAGLKLKDTFVVVDNLADLSNGANENTLEGMAPILRALRKIAHKYGCPIMVIHHSTKDGRNPRGHSSIRNSVDNLLFIEESRTDAYLLKSDKARRCRKFPDERLVRDPIPAFLSSSDKLDTDETAGFIWVSKGPSKQKAESGAGEAASGDEDHRGMTPAGRKMCRCLVECFKAIDEVVSSAELRQRYRKVAHRKDDAAKKAIGAKSPAVVGRYIGRTEVGSFELGEAGRQLFLQIHGNAVV